MGAVSQVSDSLAMMKSVAIKRCVVLRLVWVSILLTMCSCSVMASETECTSCIREYNYLETFVLGNPSIKDDLTKVFLPTGKDASHYVEITYKYSVCKDNVSVVCHDKESTFIWSDSPFFLLGPKPLFWFTFFAVNVAEQNITIELPCLCQEEFCSLVSRLTYLVCTYTAIIFLYVM